MDLIALSRVVSRALRHEPWSFGLELDEEGWVPVEALLAALRAEGSVWSGLVETDLGQMIAQSRKQRHELRGDKIRALYGHSTAQRVSKDRARPPATLYHGTSPESAAVIRRDGLKAMGRQYVHLSADVETAVNVGMRKARPPVILQIDADTAHTCGIPFYHGNETVWLADNVPPKFITLMGSSE